ncbi:MAG: hypothetical protein SGI90_03605 [Candidatus Eisenbacteria bacterium]|nr:hypothetical protein [Candidatus Eisenbacteria bacterium]
MNDTTLRFPSGVMKTTLALLLALTITMGAPLPGQACCVANFADQPVRIAGQEVLIVWDAETGTEHFVRRANFRAGQATESFGFLVPTPKGGLWKLESAC